MMIPELIHTFESTIQFMERSVADLSDEQMVQQPPGVPNHGAWTLGHIVASCQGIAEELGLEPWLPAEWESIYGYGSVPVAAAERYPSKDELVGLLKDGAERICRSLRAADAAMLARPLPEEIREQLPTVSHALVQVLAAHTAYHAGQLSAWRRAIGVESAGVFI